MNLKWDLTPANYIKMIVTEIGKFPASSVPVILNKYKLNLEKSYD